MTIDAPICKDLHICFERAFVLMAYLNANSFKPQVGVLLFPLYSLYHICFYLSSYIAKFFYSYFNLLFLFLRIQKTS